MAEPDEPTEVADERPRGLLGLLLWPLQQLLLGGIRLAVALVGGILAGLFKGLTPGATADEERDDEPGDGADQ